MGAVTLSATLSDEERTFALAVIEYNGNLGAAYRAAFGPDVSHPIARARELICKPEIAKYLAQLAEATQEHALVSLGSHLGKLAELRDLAVTSGDLKQAINAEKLRGEAAGFYSGSRGVLKDPNKGPSTPHVVINIGSGAANVSDWSKKHGTGNIVDVG